MRILGIDPGYDIVGWSVINDDLTVVEYGVIKTDPGSEFEDRLLHIHRGLDEIIEMHKPECASIEKLYFQKNVKTAMSVANAIGVIMLTLKLRNISFCEYTPTQVKQAVTGFGKASKEQMQLMMSRILGLKKISGPDDAADALAIAVCHSLGSVRNRKIRK